ncbi:MAG: condensation domain-containing protein, partial [Blastocatellia bacterium]
MEPVRPYRDYIAWLQQQDFAEAEAFWKEKLKGFTTPPRLGSRSASESSTEEAETHGEARIRLLVSETNQLMATARRRRLTPSTLVQGVWALLLSRYRFNDDVVFGMVFSGRPSGIPHVESIIGPFINTLPVRVHVFPSEKLAAWLSRIQEDQAEMAHHQHCPLSRIQLWSEMAGNQPLFESVIAFENYPVDSSLADDRWTFKIGDVSSFDRTNYPLTIAVEPERELSISMVYDSAIFELPSITRMLGHLRTGLKAMVANMDQRLSDISLLTSAETSQLLFEWNDTAVEYEDHKPIHELFEDQLNASGDSIAAVFGPEQITYGVLNLRANRLSGYLRRLGVETHERVGLHIERSVEMLVGMLGVLKAGAAYVPLDLEWPRERLQQMV